MPVNEVYPRFICWGCRNGNHNCWWPNAVPCDCQECHGRAHRIANVDAEAVALRHSQSHEDAEGARDRVS